MHRDDVAVDKSVEGAREIDRRTIAKGVAWTVPVVIVATAAPAAAASGGVTISASRANGQVTLSFRNDGSSPVKVSIISVTPGTGWAFGKEQNIPAGKSGSFVSADKAPSASILTVSYTVAGVTYSSAVPVATA